MMKFGERSESIEAPARPRSRPRRYRGARIFDFACATLGIVAFSPLLAFVTLVILIDDGRPLLFRQPRVGRDAHSFVIWKFRTMNHGGVTRSGRWLRATGLDETLQFINVLRDEMAMVGPRPLTRADVRRLGFDEAAHLRRVHQAPGITGVAQLLGTTSATATRRWEDWYEANARLPLDMVLVLASAIVNVVGKRRMRQWVHALVRLGP